VVRITGMVGQIGYQISIWSYPFCGSLVLNESSIHIGLGNGIHRRKVSSVFLTRLQTNRASNNAYQRIGHDDVGQHNVSSVLDAKVVHDGLTNIATSVAVLIRRYSYFDKCYGRVLAHIQVYNGRIVLKLTVVIGKIADSVSIRGDSRNSSLVLNKSGVDISLCDTVDRSEGRVIRCARQQGYRPTHNTDQWIGYCNVGQGNLAKVEHFETIGDGIALVRTAIAVQVIKHTCLDQ